MALDKELEDWIASLGTPESEAMDFIDTARWRGARIKKGRHTEKVLIELLEPLFRHMRETQTEPWRTLKPKS